MLVILTPLKKISFIFLTALGLSCRMTIRDLCCSIWDLVSQQGIEPGPPALEAWSVSHWTSRKVSAGCLLSCNWTHPAAVQSLCFRFVYHPSLLLVVTFARARTHTHTHTHTHLNAHRPTDAFSMGFLIPRTQPVSLTLATGPGRY